MMIPLDFSRMHCSLLLVSTSWTLASKSLLTAGYKFFGRCSLSLSFAPQFLGSSLTDTKSPFPSCFFSVAFIGRVWQEIGTVKLTGEKFLHKMPLSLNSLGSLETFYHPGTNVTWSVLDTALFVHFVSNTGIKMKFAFHHYQNVL